MQTQILAKIWEDTNHNWANITFNSDATFSFSIAGNQDEKYLGVWIYRMVHGGKDLKGKWRKLKKINRFLNPKDYRQTFS